MWVMQRLCEPGVSRATDGAPAGRWPAPQRPGEPERPRGTSEAPQGARPPPPPTEQGAHPTRPNKARPDGTRSPLTAIYSKNAYDQVTWN